MLLVPTRVWPVLTTPLLPVGAKLALAADWFHRPRRNGPEDESVAEFVRTLSTLLQGGLPIVAALQSSAGSVSSPLLARGLEQARIEVMGGRPLSESLRMTGFFPPMALDMIEVGETTGALPSMLESVAEFFEEDVNIDLSTLVAMVDPIMIASIAIVVAFVLVAFYLPLFSLAAQVH